VFQRRIREQLHEIRAKLWPVSNVLHTRHQEELEEIVLIATI